MTLLCDMAGLQQEGLGRIASWEKILSCSRLAEPFASVVIERLIKELEK